MFRDLKTFETICSLNDTNSYFIISNYALFEYDTNWNFVKEIPNSFFNNETLHDFKFIDRMIYATKYGGIYQYTSNWTEFAFYLNAVLYHKIIYDKKGDKLLATRNTDSLIDVFDRNLKFLKSIRIPNTASDIKEYNNKFFIATFSSKVFVLQNDVVVTSFSTFCVYSIRALAIDLNGLLAIACSNTTIYVYNSIGEYMNISWTSFEVSFLRDMSFDIEGNFVITTSNGVYLINTQTSTIPSIFQVDNSCTHQSNL